VSEDVAGERDRASLRRALQRYRVAANVVGVLLIVLVLVGLPLNEAHRLDPGWFPEGSSAQQLGAAISQYLGVAHGYLYMLFVVLAFLLSRKARWDLGFTLVTLVCGTVPVLSFWAERRATRRVRRQLAEAAGSSYAGQR
jgi:integral membrane protein